MPNTTEELRQSLLAHDPQFRQLAEEHLRCETELEQIHNELYLNSEDLIQEITLKKLKLRLKDQMELMVARHQRQLVHH
jgi:uncharacterized protein YdcH (DUF465 family)